jgi:8-oxo-dGTP pyrophosphatase MutT (NUDIX family)
MDLSQDQIQDLVNRYAPKESGIENLPKFRKASVLVPLFFNCQWNLLFIRRTEMVLEHKGQVAFPGGGVEIGDHDEISTALREAYEEIGLRSSNAKVLGKFQQMPTVTDYLITPVIALIRRPYVIKLQRNEVDRVFAIPLQWLSDPAHFEVRQIHLPDGVLHKVYYFQPYLGEILWGITAKITIELLATLGLYKNKPAAVD